MVILLGLDGLKLKVWNTTEMKPENEKKNPSDLNQEKSVITRTKFAFYSNILTKAQKKKGNTFCY